MLPRTTLLEPAQALCQAFARSAPVPVLLSHFTSDPMPIAHEHGHPDLAPFLGRTFNGVDGVGHYFDLIAEHLAFEHVRFDPDDEWLVDGESLAVCVRGRARLVWRATGQSWNETFCYRLGLAEDQEGRGLKVQEYRVWADTGAAYLASQGRLRELEGRSKKETREVMAGSVKRSV
ncbi:hypothetical protein VTN02DRAFT_2755 [Thermoascus thermophilus]